ncbi:MAG: glycosyltransferase family 2 protein [Ferruginibacter sp.]
MNIDSLPIVSVLMTAYNREKYLADAVESVLNSTFTDFEIIIVDDCSTDKTSEIAKSLQAKDKRVRYFRNENNLGDYPNRNKAASLARGKYLKYIDSDDAIYPWGLEWMVKMMESFPEAGWGLCSMEQNSQRIFPFQLTPREAYAYHYEGPGLFKRSPLSSIFRKDLFDQLGGFNPIRMAGDFDMWHRMAAISNVVLMPEGMVWYRKHDAQEMNDYSEFIVIYEQIKVKYLTAPNCPLPQKNISEIFKKEKAKMLRNAKVSLLKRDFKIYKVAKACANLYPV